MRDTEYAREIVTASLLIHDAKEDNEEARIERLEFKQSGQEGIRFSWWREGRLLPRPLDLTEPELLNLFQIALTDGVFTPEFRQRLRELL